MITAINIKIHVVSCYLERTVQRYKHGLVILVIVIAECPIVLKTKIKNTFSSLLLRSAALFTISEIDSFIRSPVCP
jgi:hypothetical protein